MKEGLSAAEVFFPSKYQRL